MRNSYNRVYHNDEKILCFFCNKLLIDKDPKKYITYYEVQLKKGGKFFSKCEDCKIEWLPKAPQSTIATIKVKVMQHWNKYHKDVV